MTNINEGPAGAAPEPIKFYSVPDLTDVTDRQIVTALVNACIARGYLLSVHSEGETDVRKSRDQAAIIEAIYALDECELTARLQGETHDLLWLYLIPGNGSDVICDYNDTQLAEDVVNEALISAAKVVTP